MIKKLALTLVGLCILVLGAGLFMLLDDATTAQPDGGNMQARIQDLSARGLTMTFFFAEPIAPNITFRDVTGANLMVGDDHVCFAEHWNDGLRWRCTPFYNITSLTYIE